MVKQDSRQGLIEKMDTGQYSRQGLIEKMDTEQDR